MYRPQHRTSISVRKYGVFAAIPAYGVRNRDDYGLCIRGAYGGVGTGNLPAVIGSIRLYVVIDGTARSPIYSIGPNELEGGPNAEPGIHAVPRLRTRTRRVRF